MKTVFLVNQVINDFVSIRNFVSGHSDSNAFFLPEYYNFYLKQKNYKPFYIICYKDTNNEIIGLISGVIQKFKKVFSRAVIYGSPLTKTKENEYIILETLLKELDKETKSNTIYLEIRNNIDSSSNQLIYKKYGFSFIPHLNYLINTKNEDAIQNIKKEKLRQINKSLKNGTEIKLASNIKEIEEFYLILKDLYLTKVKKPLPSKQFFFDFFNFVVSKNKGIVLLVKNKNKIIGGALCPIFENNILYDWYRGGLDNDYKKLYPSTVAAWAGIDYSVKNNFELYDFMGAGKPDEEYGVRKFKSQFGGDLVNYGRYIKINNAFLYKLSEFGLKIVFYLKRI